MNGGERDDGITQAMRCVRAMQGQDEETRASLWRAACKYAARDRLAAGAQTSIAGRRCALDVGLVGSAGSGEG